MRTRVLLAIAVLFTMVSVPAHADDKKDDPTKDIINSAMGKGAEVAAKALAKLLYDTSCTTGNNDPANKYICGILGSVSGRAEEEWKADLTKKLDEISSKLRTIQKGQTEIKDELKAQHEEMTARFDQASTNIVAVKNIVRIEGLWEKYVDQFDKVDNDVTRDSMLAFAKDIVKNDIHTILADLNVVLTKDVLDGQPLLRYPFYEARLKIANGGTIDRVPFNKTYDFAEKKFGEFRSSEQKAFAMYLWAATVLESQCKLNPTQCTQLPRSTADFKGDYDRYTRQQAETFNAAVDWFVLQFGNWRNTTDGSLLPFNAPGILTRANIATAEMLGEGGGQGLWGRVYSMGDKWDGAIEVNCNGTSQTLKPVFKYSTQVAGPGTMFIGPNSGPADWWVSRGRNGTYDEVRFANRWQVYHYSLPSAPAGRCTVGKQLPGGGILPWPGDGATVVNAEIKEKVWFRFGSFLAGQRAGGTYALVSGGNWYGSTQPNNTFDGKGQREKVTDEWFIEPNTPSGPWIGLLNKGRGEYKVGNTSSRIHNRQVISLTQTKKVYFPEDREVKLSFFPGACKAGHPVCNESVTTVMLKYNIENNDTESKKGKLDAFLAVYFDPSDRPLTVKPSNAGVVVDGSYDKTGDRKELSISTPQHGLVKTDPNTGYHLVYLMYFDLETEGRGWDATEYMYRGLLAPGAMYLTK